LDEYENVQLIKLDVQQDQKVRITAGPFMNQEGKVIEVKNKSAKILIESLRCLLVADIDKNKLLPMQPY
jgi:transcription antitermination factor NusG